ncbi:MAG: branched-chain amino acid ABC transporter permease [Desulfobacterales bacterium]|nr:branched-chain amino acid ABC transporter permease [Desulfobacterales bacterium]
MFLQQIASGLALGCVYALIALGFVLIYKATEVVNFAQGEFMMLGAFVALSLMTGAKLPFFLTIFLAVMIMGVFGMVLERMVMRRLVGEPIFALVMFTIGLSIFLRSIAGMVWSTDTFKFPTVFGKSFTQIGSVTISSMDILVVSITAALVIILYLFFKFTDIGIAMEATSQNQFASFLMGISVERVFNLIWAISAMVAAVAGILLAPILFIHKDMGFIGLKAFPAAVLGGFGSIPGAIVGGLIIGLSENLAGVFLPAWVKDVFAYIILIAVLMVRPEGIFGIQEKKRV